MSRIASLLTVMGLAGISLSARAEDRRTYFATHPASQTSVTGLAISSGPAPYAKPVMIVEGFDTDDGTGDEFDLAEFESELTTSGMKAALLGKGYTIVLVDMDQNWADLKNNAKAVGNLAQAIWTDSRKQEPIKLIGLSMGGLVASLATRIKEYEIETGVPISTADRNLYNSWNFRTNLAITFDTPHRGAYVPVGLQAFVGFYQGLDGGSAAVQPYRALTSTAATQMLLMGTGGSTAVRNAWQNYYNGYLDRMKQRQNIRLVGIVKGSWNGQKQYPGSEGQKVFHWEHDPTGCGDTRADVWTQGRSDRKVFDAFYGVCFIDNIWYTFYEASGFPNLENAPGGWKDGWADLAARLPHSPAATYANFTFVPAFSAAALDYATFSPNNKDNFAANEATMGSMVNYSRLHKLYTHLGGNEEHSVVTPQDGAWMLTELSRASNNNAVAAVFAQLFE
jgi:hypothetical protein